MSHVHLLVIFDLLISSFKGFYTNTVLYIIIGRVDAFTSAAYSTNPVSHEKWLEHLQL